MWEGLREGVSDKPSGSDGYNNGGGQMPASVQIYYQVYLITIRVSTESDSR